MSLFHSVLAQIEQTLVANNSHTTLMANIISTTLGTTISPDVLRVQENTLYITTSGSIKMAIKLRQKALITALQQAHFTITAIR